VPLPPFRQVTLLGTSDFSFGLLITIPPHVGDISCDENRSLANIHHGSVSNDRALLRSCLGIFS
jgi:hypothetical protein